jgi:hypothetical protein
VKKIPLHINLSVLAAALALQGCDKPATEPAATAPKEMSNQFEAICIDGVQYWLAKNWGTSVVMSPRISRTGSYLSCPVPTAPPTPTEINPSQIVEDPRHQKG